jgi:phosphatidylglycerol---prolipoprotein diacylglyceryl transferase
MISYILWDESTELFSWGQFTLRWNGLLLFLAFIVGRQILVHIYKKEGKPAKDVDVLTTYLVIAAFIGARLGHVIFYQPQLWAKPLAIFFPFEFNPSFHFTGMTGFSSHGAVFGILFAVWLYSLRKKTGQRYLQVMDSVSILSVWIAIPILIGSFLNSDIQGKPTGSAWGTVFIKPITDGLLKLPCCIMRNPGGKNPLNLAIAKKANDVVDAEKGHYPVALYLFFKQDVSEKTVDEFMLGDVKTYLYDMSKIVVEPGTEPLHYVIFKEPNGDFEVRVRTIGIARYPVQLIESASCLLLFAFIFWYWNTYKLNLTSGRIFGFCMTLFWMLQFAYEFLKEEQDSFLEGIELNTAQTLCIPLMLTGLAVLILSYRKHRAVEV